MLGPPARSPVIVRGERHSHAEASSASRLGARRRCGWIHYCVRRAAFKRLGIKRPFSPNVWILVVKLREAAFGSLGPMRLCSRACLVLICCTPKLNKYYTYGA